MPEMNVFTGLSRTARVMIAWVIAVCLVLMAAGAAAIAWVHPFEPMIPYIAGVALGCVHSILKIALMEKSLIRTMDMEKDGAVSIGRLHFFGRYLLTGVVFVIAILTRGAIGLFGTIAGILSLQIAAYIVNQVLRNKTVR